MPTLFLYIVKVSVIVAVVYIFYRLFLQRLTFYNSNRWYLLAYSFLSFFIPFINISNVVEQNNLSSLKAVQFIPVINELKINQSSLPAATGLTLTLWNYLFIIFSVGVLVMMVRFLAQWASFLNIKRKARLLLNENVNLYGVNKNIMPFSFGRNVFINPNMHNEEDLKKILHHEYVHVREFHTVDIIWAEILCLFNWYNPFAWCIRYSIRQNLEFIADHKVLENGVEKKQYQYLLLKVLGVPQFHIGASFNLSSLKTRIVMMNKIKSAKVHMLKFLFMLPLLAVLLLAFRVAIKQDDKTLQEPHLVISGLVMQDDNYKPLSNVRILDSASKSEATTDEKGFYKINVAVRYYPYHITLVFSKDGYQDMGSKTELGSQKGLNEIDLQFVGMSAAKNDSKLSKGFLSVMRLPRMNAQLATYELVAKEFDPVSHKQSLEEEVYFRKIRSGTQKPYWVINGHTYLINASGGTAMVETVTDIVFVDGIKMTGEDVNRKFNRSMINTVGAVDREPALKKYGINQAVMEIFVDAPKHGSYF